MKEIRVLVVEDDADIAEAVSRTLGQSGMPCTIAATIADANRLIAKEEFTAAVVDLTLPDGDGLTLTRWLKEHTNLGILILSARGETTERIVGLEIGADDFIPKPFEPRELLARMRALVRRLDRQGDAGAVPHETKTARSPDLPMAPTFLFEGMTLDTERRTLTDEHGDRIDLTTAEFNVLHVLIERAGRVLSRDQIMDLTHGSHRAAFDRSIDVLVGRVRRKIHDATGLKGLIQTVRNIGFQFAAPVTRR